MDIRTMQKLSRMTEKASAKNDLTRLRQLKKLIEAAYEAEEFKDVMGAEWFYSMLTSEQMDAIDSEEEE